MEVFATFGLIVLVGLAIPIILLFAALVFDLVVVLYAVATTTRIRKRKRRGGEPSSSRGVLHALQLRRGVDLRPSVV